MQIWEYAKKNNRTKKKHKKTKNERQNTKHKKSGHWCPIPPSHSVGLPTTPDNKKLKHQQSQTALYPTLSPATSCALLYHTMSNQSSTSSTHSSSHMMSNQHRLISREVIQCRQLFLQLDTLILEICLVARTHELFTIKKNQSRTKKSALVPRRLAGHPSDFFGQPTLGLSFVDADARHREHNLPRTHQNASAQS